MSWRRGWSTRALPRRAAGIAVFAVVMVAAGLARAVGCVPAAPKDARFATIEGRRVAYRVIGAGRPALVMISGLGEGMASFEAAAPALATKATLILYDRAGYGASAPGPPLVTRRPSPASCRGCSTRPACAAPMCS